MNPRRVERINGYECRVLSRNPFAVASIDETGRHIAVGMGRTEKEACKELVDKVYRIHCRIVDEQQGFKCAQCGKLGPLQHHHRVHRGMGSANRDDRVANLEGLCPEDHERIHKGGK